MASRPDYDCEFYVDKATCWRWRVRAANGETLASGEAYRRIDSAVEPLAGLLGWPEWVAEQLVDADPGTAFRFQRTEGSTWQAQVLNPLKE